MHEHATSPENLSSNVFLANQNPPPTKIYESQSEVDNRCSLIIILQARHSITQFLQTDSQTRPAAVAFKYKRTHLI